MAEAKAKLQSPGLESEKDFIEKGGLLNLDTKMSEAIGFYQDRIRKAFMQREQSWEYFDGLNYYDDYIMNRRVANTYLRPKKNDDEVRIATGTTEKKIEVIYNELLSLNLQPEVRAYDDKDNLIMDLSEDFTDLVARTNEIEKDDYLWSEAILELLTQRAVFLEERWEDKAIRDKQSKGGVRRLQRCVKHIIPGLKVFLGNIKLPWYRFDEQPYIATYDRIHWKEAEALFKDNPMWKYVKKGGATENGIFSMRLGILDEDELELITYKSFPDDEEMRMLNGVPMDPLGTKLSWEWNGYNMKMFCLKTMARNFSYGRPLTASAKTLQALDDESIRLVIRKWQQALEPPLGVKGDKIFSKDIWSPAAQTQGLTKGMFEKLIDHDGPTTGDFNILKFIQDKTEEFIGAGDLQQGQETKGQQTAMEIRTLQRQFIKQLGLAVFGYMAMKKEMTFLRLYNVLENAVTPIGKKVDSLTNKVVDSFRKFTRENAKLENGKMGRKEIIFYHRSLTPKENEALYKKEQEKEKIGEIVRYHVIDVKQLLSIPLYWYVVVNQSVKDSEDLDKAMFTDSLTQAAAVSKIAGRPLSGDVVIEDWERTWKKKNWFQKQAPEQILSTEQGGGMKLPGKQVGEEMTPSNPQNPSINTLNEPVTLK